MSRPALIEKLMQAGQWLFRPELIPLPDLVKTGGGLAVDTKTGKLYVDFSLVPDDQMQAIVLAMVQEGGGLAVDGKGQLYVDFASMPTDKFETMLKSIRVPVWLTKSTAFYVNSSTGVDNHDEGRGLSASLPFKTLPYAISYITDNYNLSSYNVTLWLAPGLYTASSCSFNSGIVTLGGFSGQGTITIRGESPEAASSTILNYLFVLTQASNWAFQDVTISPTITETRGPGVNVLDVSKGQVDLYNVFLDCLYIENNEARNARNFLYARGYGYIRVYATNDFSIPSGITFNFRDKQLDLNPLAASTGTLQFTADINISGGGGVTTFCQMSLLSMCSFSLSSFVNPGRAPKITMAEGIQVTGKRYSINNNSIVSTGGNGPDFFPGDTAGTIATGSQYS